MEQNVPTEQPPIALNIRAELERTGFSKTYVGMQMGVDSRQIRRWADPEQGNPSWESLVALADVFGRDPAWFYIAHDQAQEAA